jgi:hypothetical protein
MEDLLKHVKVEIWKGHWTREDVIDNSHKLFLYGGNIVQDFIQKKALIPKITQAVIRGLPNAVPVCTKWTSGTNDAAYFSDEDIEEFKDYLACSYNALQVPIKYFDVTNIVIPSIENGIGTGTAYLQEKAPKCWEALQDFMMPFYKKAIEDQIKG